MAYKIRKAIENDLSRIIELYEELTNEKIEIQSSTAKEVLRAIETIPTGELLVIEDDGFIAGTIFILIMPNLSHNAHPWGLIENMVVDKSLHRRGIGRKLLEYTVERCRQAGCYKVQLMSTDTRKDAHKFYRALGFENTALGFRLYLQDARD
jgi:N-acetylglutamate synthase-like GNAT family acetyltransferase